MINAASQQITLLLVDWSRGNEFALEQLMPLVYDELRRMARRYMRGQPSGHTFQTTELIHEAYLKLAKRDAQNWQNRAHFFGVAAKAMRHILVDYARVLNTVGTNAAACSRRILRSKKISWLRRSVPTKSSRSTMR